MESVIKGGYTTLVLADGLGSGVKANILSTLTSKILCTMIADGADIEDSVSTLVSTLPVCKERELAYSTFTVVRLDDSGRGRMIEFDNPEAVYYSGGKCADIERTERILFGKKVYESELNLKVGDMIFIFSDGVVNAGEGMILKNGWMRPQIKEYLEKNVTPDTSASAAACRLGGACYDLYVEKPMDDTTVAAVKLRGRKKVNVMVGPPVDKENDDIYLDRFISADGGKIVCGGTTAHIVANYLKKEIDTGFDIIDTAVPPISAIDGIDLVTEGVLTLKKVKEMSDMYISHTDLTAKTFGGKDGASLFMQAVFEMATDIVFFVGQSVNTAHDNTVDTTVKLKLVEAIADNLKKAGKKIKILYD